VTATAIQPHAEVSVTVAGKRVRVLKGGSGPALVTLHHSTGSLGWLPLHERLSEQFTVYAPDMPGYGQSERPEWARDPRDIAILLNHALRKLGVSGVTLVGFGFGGYVAAELASMDQSKLAKLVLVGAAGLQPSEGEIMDQMVIDFADYMKDGFRDEAAYEAVFGHEPDASVKELWDFSREMSARLSWKPYMFNNRLAHTLRDVEVPTLIVYGSGDKVVPPVVGSQYKAALINARLEILDGFGHYVEYEDAARTAELIASFARS
jgi:pimeloyl-ACP methyl ester carboxylesterase